MLTARVGGLLCVSLLASLLVTLLGGPAIWLAVSGAWAALPTRGAGVRGASAAAGDADAPLGATLVFATTDVDIGQIEPGESRRVEVPWRREGAGPLRVVDVFTGCGCVVAGGLGAPRPDPSVSRHVDAGVPSDAGVLEEGATGTLVLEIAGRARAGPFMHIVRVVTDGPAGGVHAVRVRGFVGSATVVSPAALLMGEVRPEERVVRWITVRPPPGRPVPSVDAKFSRVNATLRGVPPGRAGAVGWDLEVTLTAPRDAGPFAGFVELRLGDEAIVRVPIDGVVEGKP